MSRLAELAIGLVAVSGFGSDMMAKTCPFSAPAPIPPACEDAFEQSPADVSIGAEEGMREGAGTLVEDYEAAGMCVVNVHFHLGAEHKSAGQYDVDGAEFMASLGESERRRLAAAEDYPGWFCQGYDAEDPKYTTEYEWEYCEGVHVGMTYEIHWPASTHGHCGRFTDGLGGLFCYSQTPDAIGVQGQVFMIVNDEDHLVDDLTSGMRKDLASDVAMYTGSSTGPSYSDEICSPYAPISWHVDRECHLLSAKSFDHLCKYMKDQGQTKDLEPHGSRDTVIPLWVVKGMGVGR